MSEARFDSYDAFFSRAMGFGTDKGPYPYQRRLATDDELPDLLDVPTGLGKTAAVVLAWLWRRRFHSNGAVRTATPRRLVYCLPMRVLVEQTRDNARKWLDRLGLGALDDNGVAVTVLMGGEDADEWDLFPERDAIVIGTQDMLLSRALNRGYAMSRYRWPMHFGLLNNDCLWVMDEVQLMGNGLATTAQLQAFRTSFGTWGVSKSLWMSATIRPDWLSTVDFDVRHLVRRELDGDDHAIDDVRRRLEATKSLTVLPASEGDVKSLSQAVVREHRAGTRTIAIVNTVRRAQELFEALRKAWKDSPEGPEVVLVHSRFRPPERKVAMDRALAAPSTAGTVVVSTQVIEAGVDVSSTTLFTDLAPWSSLVQRFGRCNRYGNEQTARVLIVDLDLDDKKSVAPYAVDDLERARGCLDGLDDVCSMAIPEAQSGPKPTRVVRRRDLVDLFDTTPDLAGADLDVSMYIRDEPERDVHVFWRDVPKDQKRPGDDEPLPARDELCAAPIGDVEKRVKDGSAWRWDALERQWTRADVVFPGLTVMLRAADGGYSPESGWGAGKKNEPIATPNVPPGRGGGNDANDSDQTSESAKPVTLAEHVSLVVDHARAILDALPVLAGWRRDLELAARWHDVGKAHQVFQSGLREANAACVEPTVWAKSGARKPLRFSRKGFRHELASALSMLEHGLPDLAAYLAAAHHGKVRLSIRSLPHETPPREPDRRFARGVWDRDPLPAVDLGGGQAVTDTTLDLSCMDLGEGDRGPSWLARTLALRDSPELGLFRLAFMEAVLRAADNRGSQAGEKGDAA